MSIDFSENRQGPVRRFRLLAVLVAVGLVVAACGDDDDDAGSQGGGSRTTAAGSGTDRAAPEGQLRLGYFPNVTHGPAIIGVEEGIFAAALGDEVEFDTTTFNAGPEAVETLFAGALDASFIGPNPAINAFAQSNGSAIRIISGSTSGGAALIVRDGIESADDLVGTTIATPQLGNTQDVALRAWLQEEGIEADTAGGGEVSIRPQSNADTLAAFIDGTIDAAWVPEPWATRLQLEGDGNVLVDEKDLWPDGRFVTTHLIVRTEYLEENPAIIKALLEGVVEAIEFANDDADKAKTVVNGGIEAITGSALSQETIDGAWENLTFTWDPVATSLAGSKDDAVEVGLLDDVDLEGIYDLTLLNEVLASLGQDEVVQL